MTNPIAEATNPVPTQTAADVAQSPSHRGRWMLLSGIALFLAVVVATVMLVRSSDGPIPRVSDIATMQAWIEDTHPPRRFDVPRNHYRSIRAALAPSRVDRDPAKCQGIGAAKIKTRRGREVFVPLFTSGFSVDGTHYAYPSGTYHAVEDAILAARVEAESEHP